MYQDDLNFISKIIDIINTNKIKVFKYKSTVGWKILIKSYTTKRDSFTKPTENTVKLNLKGSSYTEDVKGLNFKTINAPLTGIFYTSPSPESKPFVNLNEKISKNSNLCIIEAMKVMNTIKAPYDCTLIEILVNNEELVECGQPLFKVSV